MGKNLSTERTFYREKFPKCPYFGGEIVKNALPQKVMVSGAAVKEEKVAVALRK